MAQDLYHRPGQVVEEPAEETQRREQAATARQAAAPPGFPPPLMPEIHAFEGAFAVPNFEAVLWQRSLDLAHRFLGFHDAALLIARMFYRQAKRAARDGRAL